MNLMSRNKLSAFLVAILFSLVLGGCMPEPELESEIIVAAEPLLENSPAYPAAGIPAFSTEHIASKGFYYAGGEYVGDPPIMGGQMYVEIWEPRDATQPYPL